MRHLEPAPLRRRAHFFQAFEDFGATYLQTRTYQRPAAGLTSASHWAAGGVVTRIARKEWPGSGAFDYICFECNALLDAIRENRTRYRSCGWKMDSQQVSL